MAGWTLNGKSDVLDGYFRGATIPTNFYVALCTSATAPAYNTTTLGTLTQIDTGNGYSDGGYQLTPNSTYFDVLQTDATDDVMIQLADVFWNASGGPIPSGGSGARYAVLTDDNGTVGSRRVLYYWDLISDRTVSSGQTLTLQNCEARLNEP